jgi:hypothetical protein
MYISGIYIYILSGSKKRPERFPYMFCANVFSTFVSVKKCKKHVKQTLNTKTEEEHVDKMHRKHVGNGVLFHHPSTPPPGGGIFPQNMDRALL